MDAPGPGLRAAARLFYLPTFRQYTANDPPEAAIKPIGPGQTARLITRPAWRFARRRPVLAAWLAFAVVASVLPFLLFAIVYEPDGHGVWVVGGGGVYRWPITRAEGAQMGEPESMLRWEPSIANRAFFTWKSYNAAPGAPRQSVLIIGGPTWPFFLAPTVVALVILHARRTLLDRRLNQQRAAGRTPCPACQYDATGLSVCPECGASVGAGRAG